jgi:ATPase subunit of ABC transporter with duplicated ATPase domains
MLAYGVSAVGVVKLSRFSRSVFMEIDKRFKAGKKSKKYFCGFKSIEKLCAYLHISKKQFYNVINDNRGGRKKLPEEEQKAKDVAKEDARVKREEAKADREATKRAENARLKREAEELKRLRANMQVLSETPTAGMKAAVMPQANPTPQAAPAGKTKVVTRTVNKKNELLSQITTEVPFSIDEKTDSFTVQDGINTATTFIDSIADKYSPLDSGLYLRGVLAKIEDRLNKTNTVAA